MNVHAIFSTPSVNMLEAVNFLPIVSDNRHDQNRTCLDNLHSIQPLFQILKLTPKAGYFYYLAVQWAVGTVETETGKLKQSQLDANKQPLINDHLLKTTSVQKARNSYVPKMTEAYLLQK